MPKRVLPDKTISFRSGGKGGLTMEKKSAETPREKYLRSREFFRQQAREQFFNREHARSLVDVIDDYVAGTMLAVSDEDISGIANAEYIGGLTVSFTRSHFTAMDLIASSELIDGVTLLRKQFELVARLKELAGSESGERLLEKTPNLQVLKREIRRLYGEYSRIAHSAHPQPLQLLGTIERNEGDYTPLYPVFVENSYVALNHAVHVVVEYYSWAHPFCAEHSAKYDRQWGEKWIEEVVRVHAMFEKH
jgi:hypothetical protein